MRSPVSRLTRRPIGLALSVVPVFTAVLLLGTPGAATPPEKGPTVSLPSVFETGLIHHAGGRYDQAVETFDAAIAKYPTADAYYWRGESLRKTWWLDRATADFDRAIKLDPKHAYAYLGRGLIHEYRGYFDLAEVDYSTAARLDPKLALTYIHRGGLRWKHGRIVEARADLNRGVQLCTAMLRQQPNEPQAYRARALAWRTLESYDQAIEDHTQVIRLSPDSAEAYIERGRTYANRHGKNVATANVGEQMTDKIASVADFDKAIDLATAVLVRCPRDASTLRLRAEAYEARAFAWKDPDDFRRAVTDCGAVLGLAPNCPTAYFRRGHTHAGASHYSGDREAGAAHFRQAEEDLSRVVRLDPTYAAAWHERGLLYVRAALGEEKPELAQRGVADLTETIRLVPRGALVYCARGSAYGLAGDMRRALDDFNRAVQLCPEMADAYALRGGVNMALGKQDAAQADLARAQELRTRTR